MDTKKLDRAVALVGRAVAKIEGRKYAGRLLDAEDWDNVHSAKYAIAQIQQYMNAGKWADAEEEAENLAEIFGRIAGKGPPRK